MVWIFQKLKRLFTAERLAGSSRKTYSPCDRHRGANKASPWPSVEAAGPPVPLGRATANTYFKSGHKLRPVTLDLGVAMTMYPRQGDQSFTISFSQQPGIIDGTIRYEQLDNRFIRHPQGLVWKFELHPGGRALTLYIAPHYVADHGEMESERHVSMPYVWKSLGSFSFVPSQVKGVLTGQLAVLGPQEQGLEWRHSTLSRVGDSVIDRSPRPIPPL